jgi:hypothetical protein
MSLNYFHALVPLLATTPIEVVIAHPECTGHRVDGADHPGGRLQTNDPLSIARRQSLGYGLRRGEFIARSSKIHGGA